ncbi:MAG: hypothetical protein LBO72_08525 [Helicobacteraceae bacterium]|nr:hypothetical protein [Helicobacteraceae bacterium]
MKSGLTNRIWLANNLFAKSVLPHNLYSLIEPNALKRLSPPPPPPQPID